MEKATLEIEGISSYNLNLLMSAGIPAEPIRIGDYQVSVKIPSNKLPEARAVLEKHNRKYREKGLTGIKRRAFTFLTSYTLILGLVCSAVIVWLYSSLVTEISVGGLSAVKEETVIQAVLGEENLPLFYSRIDPKAVRESVLNIEGVAGATLKRNGTRLIVTVSEELPKVVIKGTQIKKNMTALTDGVVTKVVVISGTARVKAGDTVKAGRVLVEAAVYNDEGTLLEEVVPDAIVEARVWYTETLEYPDEATRSENAVRDIEARKDEFISGLSKDKLFVTYWVKESNNDKSVDKKWEISIYFEVIQSIAA